MNEKKFETPLKFYQVAGAFLQALHQPLNEQFTKLFESEEATKGADGIYAQVSAAVYPQESLIADLAARSPYGNPDQIEATLKESEGRGWIKLSDTGFSATDKSLGLTKKLIAILTEHTEGLEAVQTEIARMVELLGKLVKGAEEADLTIKPTLAYARNYEHEDKTPSLVWVRRHLITMNSFRDDCHMDAWQSQYDLPGNVWEVLTFLWRGDADTAAALAEMLPYRNYTEEEYDQALEKLVKLGWAEKTEEGFAVTEKGKKLRDEVENQTDKNYQAAFAVLSGDELEELIILIEKLTAAITPPEVEEEAQQS